MPASTRIVQVPIDDELLADLDRLTKATRTSRSALIRLACREYIRRIREEKLDDAYERGYLQFPEDTAIAKAQAKIAANILPEESW